MYTNALNQFQSFLKEKEMDMVSQRKMAVYAYKKYGIPLKDFYDLSVRKDILSATESEVFMVADSVDLVFKEKYVQMLFSEDEIKKYNEFKYVAGNHIFPLEIEGIALSDNEWLGKIDFKTLQLLNEEKKFTHKISDVLKMLQRESGDYTYYSLDKVVRNTIKYIECNEYVPVVLMLNMSGGKTEYHENKLIIQSLDRFFVADGIELIMAIDRLDRIKFNDIIVPVRITNYDFEKESRFISQEMERRNIILRKRIGE